MLRTCEHQSEFGKIRQLFADVARPLSIKSDQTTHTVLISVKLLIPKDGFPQTLTLIVLSYSLMLKRNA